MIADSSALILAGGFARRMGGRQKAFLTFEGKTLLDRQLAILSPRFSRIAISTNDPKPFPNNTTIPDRKGQGPLAGIEAGLSWCKDSHLFVLACDLPHVDDALVDELARYRSTADLVIPRCGDVVQPLLGFYAKRVLPILGERLAADAYRVLDLLDEPRLSAHLVDLPPTRAACLENWNAPEDLPE